jgi:hypothetical protein
MPATAFQRHLCRLIAENRVQSGESYVAGGVALNTLLAAPRLSRDIDLFHDTDEALRVCWDKDRALLAANQYSVNVFRQTLTFVEAVVARGTERVIVQWVRDSSFRFFPLIADEQFGLVLHPFDLATNKVLALAGRLEPRDWIDVLTTHEKVQPFGYLIWAACGKDPGFSPGSLLSEARRSGRYSQPELDELAFDGPAPDARLLGKQWHQALSEAQVIVDCLPESKAGMAALDAAGNLYRGGPALLPDDLRHDRVLFHSGRIRGVWPTIRPVKG